ncbi:MAG: ATP-binding protein [Anaerolineae bacterium]
MVKIHEELCNGCGLCVTPCVEGAIAIVNGKARVVSDALCDGAGFCLAVCPTGALSIEERDAVPFDEHMAVEHQQAKGKTYIAQRCFLCAASEEEAVLLPCRQGGQSLWVCTRCLPALIHG